MSSLDGRPLHVAQLIERLDVGGAERLAVQIANARAAAGDRSHLYVMEGPGALSDQVDENVTVCYFEYQRASVRNPVAFLASGFRGHRLLADRVRDDSIDLVQSHLPGANFWALLLQLTGKACAVPTIHNNREFDYGDADHPLRALMRRVAYRRMMTSCPAVVAVSDLVRDSMTHQLGLTAAQAQTMAVVPNGVPVPPPLASDQRREIRTRFGCGDDEILILAAGRHSEQKNFRTLVEAVKALPGDGEEFRVVIAGDGPLKLDLEAQAESLGLGHLIRFPGNVPDLRRIMQAADIFVLSSLWEGLPLVLLEAMAAGCAVAATRIAGVIEVVRDGEIGRLAEPGDAADLAVVLAELLSDPDTRRRMGVTARDEVRRCHSFDRVAADLDALYHRLIPPGAASSP